MHGRPSKSPWPVAYVDVLRRSHVRVLDIVRPLDQEPGSPIAQHFADLWFSLFADKDGTVARAAVRSLPVVEHRPPLALARLLRGVTPDTRPPRRWQEVGPALERARLEAQLLLECLDARPLVAWDEALVARLATARLARAWSLAHQRSTRIDVAIERVDDQWRVLGVSVRGGSEELWPCWQGVPLRLLAPVSVTCTTVPMRWRMTHPHCDPFPLVLDEPAKGWLTDRRPSDNPTWRADIRQLFETVPEVVFARPLRQRWTSR